MRDRVRLLPSEVREAHSLYLQGWSYKALAERLGCSKTAVEEAFVDYGLRRVGKGYQRSRRRGPRWAKSDRYTSYIDFLMGRHE